MCEGDGIIQPEELDFDAVQRLLKEFLGGSRAILSSQLSVCCGFQELVEVLWLIQDLGNPLETTPRKINMEAENQLHLKRKISLPNIHFLGFHVNFQGCNHMTIICTY